MSLNIISKYARINVLVGNYKRLSTLTRSIELITRLLSEMQTFEIRFSVSSWCTQVLVALNLQSHITTKYLSINDSTECLRMF